MSAIVCAHAHVGELLIEVAHWHIIRWYHVDLALAFRPFQKTVRGSRARLLPTDRRVLDTLVPWAKKKNVGDC